MRRIAKPSPPVNVSPNGQPKRKHQVAEREFLEALPTAADGAQRARQAFDSLDKPKLRAVLRDEQGCLCVYCERRLTTEERVSKGRPAPRIDHWRPLSLQPSLALRWDNLYLSCSTPETCDRRKQETPLRASEGDAELPWPVDHPYERCVGFSSMGEVYVRSDAPLDEAQRKALVLALGVPHDDRTKDNGILNLNHPSLVAARAAAVDAERARLQRDYAGTTASKADRQRRANEMLAGGTLADHVSVRVGWLTGTLGRGR